MRENLLRETCIAYKEILFIVGLLAQQNAAILHDVVSPRGISMPTVLPT